MNRDEAIRNLDELDAQARTANAEDTALGMICRGVPADVVAYLMDLWDKTKTIGRKVYVVGRIIVLRLWQFVRENPGLAIGVAVGVAAAVLVHGIPLLGPLLAPFVALALVPFLAVGGHRQDRRARGEQVGDGLTAWAADTVSAAWQPIKTLIAALQAIGSELTPADAPMRPAPAAATVAPTVGAAAETTA